MTEQEIKALVEKVIDSVKNGDASEGNVPVGISNRHIHLTKEHVEILFGKGYELTKIKDLSQPGQFACEEKVTVIGPKGSLKASILGPERSADQVELSLSVLKENGIDAYVIGEIIEGEEKVIL